MAVASSKLLVYLDHSGQYLDHSGQREEPRRKAVASGAFLKGTDFDRKNQIDWISYLLYDPSQIPGYWRMTR
jgi:hypothetical protein